MLTLYGPYSYYVCEKSDGIRCLMYFAEGDGGQEIHYLVFPPPHMCVHIDNTNKQKADR